MSAAQLAAENIRKAAAQAIKEEMIPKYGVGYRLSHLLGKVRELLKNRNIMTSDLLNAIKVWLDKKVVTFNNKYIIPTSKGMPEIMKFAPA